MERTVRARRTARLCASEHSANRTNAGERCAGPVLLRPADDDWPGWFALLQEGHDSGHSVFLVPHPQMATARIADEPRARNVLGCVARTVERAEQIIGRAHDQRKRGLNTVLELSESERQDGVHLG